MMFALWCYMAYPPFERQQSLGGRMYYFAGTVGLAAFRAALPHDGAFPRIPDQVGRLLPIPRASRLQTQRDVKAVDPALPGVPPHGLTRDHAVSAALVVSRDQPLDATAEARFRQQLANQVGWRLTGRELPSEISHSHPIWICDEAVRHNPDVGDGADFFSCRGDACDHHPDQSCTLGPRRGRA